MGGDVVIPIVLAIAALLVAAYLIGDAEVERYRAERDVRSLARHEAARRRLSSPRSLR